jgi:hypothetical protein
VLSLDVYTSAPVQWRDLPPRERLPHIVIVYQLPPTKGKGRPLRVDDVNVSFKNAMLQLGW